MNALQRQLQVFTLMLAVLLLAACAQLGIETPSTFEEKIAVAYGTVTQVRTTATLLLEQKKISVKDAENVLATTDVARAGLDTTRAMHTLDPAGAGSRLTAIQTGLVAISSYLSTRNK